jgi:hypothetical protein
MILKPLHFLKFRVSLVTRHIQYDETQATEDMKTMYEAPTMGD